MATRSTSAVQAAPAGGVSFPWWVTLIGGIAMIVVGLLLLAAPAATTAVIVQLLGLFWLVDGVVRLVSIFVNRSGWGWKLLMGILGIILGLAVLQHPLWSSLLVPASMVFLVGFMGMAIGLLQVIAAFRGAGWGTGLLGAFSFLLGMLIVANPVQGMIALPFVLGFIALIGGIIAPVVALTKRPATPPATTSPA